MNQEIVLILFQVVVLVFAFTMHECAHAWVAWKLGDPTAYMLGRLTLNPARHLDPFGSVLIPLISLIYGLPLIGWAKPCPVTTRNFARIRRDDILTTLAGPASNLAAATVALILLILLKHFAPGGPETIGAAMRLAHKVPVVTDELPSIFPVALLLYFGVLINLLLFVFNLIPVPPLDGSRILRHFLPYKAEQMYDRIGMFGILFIMLIGGRLIFGFFYTPLLGIFDGLLAVL